MANFYLSVVMELGFRCADCDAVQEPKGTRSREHILMVGANWFSIPTGSPRTAKIPSRQSWAKYFV